MFGLLKKRNKVDPTLENLLKRNDELEKLILKRKKENAILESEEMLKKLGYTDSDLERIAQKAKMKVIKEDEA